MTATMQAAWRSHPRRYRRHAGPTVRRLLLETGDPGRLSELATEAAHTGDLAAFAEVRRALQLVQGDLEGRWSR